MVVVCTKSGVALGAFSLSCFVSRLEAFQAKNVEAFGEHSIFLFDFAGRACQLLLKFIIKC